MKRQQTTETLTQESIWLWLPYTFIGSVHYLHGKGAWWHIGRHGSWELYIQIHWQHRERQTGPVLRFSNLKAYPQRYTTSHKVHLSQTRPYFLILSNSTSSLALKYMSLLVPVFQTTKGSQDNNNDLCFNNCKVLKLN